MKKLFSLFLMCTFIFSFSSLSATGSGTDLVLGEFTSVVSDGEAKSGSTTLHMSHRTIPISNIIFNPTTRTDLGNIDESFAATTGEKKLTIANLTINNNTRDGYEFKLVSTNGSGMTLASVGDSRDHGEADIPYKIYVKMTVQKSNTDDNIWTLANGYTSDTSITLDSNGESRLLYFGQNGAAVKTSNLRLEVKLGITNNGELAGDYAETITYQYTDN